MMLEQIAAVPALIKILSIFVFMLLLNRFRLSLSYCLPIGALVLLVWMKTPLAQWGPIVLSSVLDLQTISLVLIVDLILVMSGMMKQTGHMDRLVKSFMQLARDGRTVASVMTALIGLLPMPGGALFSAPLVEISLAGHPVSGEQKTGLNYWFRHLWEFWWPLYPGVVLALALTEVNIRQYYAVMAPLTLVAIGAGYVFILRPIGKIPNPSGQGVSRARIKSFIWEMMPILIVILVIIIQTGLTEILALLGLEIKIPGAMAILPGLCLATLWVGVVNRITWRQFKSAILEKTMPAMMMLLLGIMIFKGVMTKTSAVEAIRNELITFHIPSLLVVLIMPFLAGMITGVAIGFVGTTFPLIIPLFPQDNSLGYVIYAAMAYTFGHMGQMLSPIHICFLVTKDYFKANLWKSYRYILPPVLTILSAIIGFFLITKLF
jgi:hypothetical protein